MIQTENSKVRSAFETYASFVPDTILVPEEEFESLYASYVNDCQKRGAKPLPFSYFLGSARVHFF